MNLPVAPSRTSSAITGASADNLGQFACVAMMFVVADGNAYWPIWSGLIPTLLIAPLAIALRSADGNRQIVVDRLALPSLLSLAALALAGAVSLFVNQAAMPNWVVYVSSYVSPLLIYLAVRQYTDSQLTVTSLLAAIMLGAAIPLALGLVAYYREWGLPSGVELLMSRYMLDRMQGYMTATFGNTGNTAAYLALIIPVAGAAALSKHVGPWLRALGTALTIVCLGNALIVQSRTLLWLLVFASATLLWFFRVRIAGVVLVLLLACAVFVLPFLESLDEFVSHTTSVFQGGEADASLAERLDAMQVGARTILDNPALGVGPGNTLVVNPYTTAHQYWLQQGSELGLIGLVAAIVLSASVFLRFATIARRRSGRSSDELQFACYGGAMWYLAYGLLANVTLSNSVVNAWIGVFAALLAMGEGAADSQSTSESK